MQVNQPRCVSVGVESIHLSRRDKTGIGSVSSVRDE